MKGGRSGQHLQQLILFGICPKCHHNLTYSTDIIWRAVFYSVKLGLAVSGLEKSGGNRPGATCQKTLQIMAESEMGRSETAISVEMKIFSEWNRLWSSFLLSVLSLGSHSGILETALWLRVL